MSVIIPSVPSNGFRLSALGMVNALGSSKEQILKGLLAGDISKLTKSDSFIPGRTVPVGQVHEEFVELPQNLSHLASRNSSLLYSAFQQIEKEVVIEREQFGPHRIGVVLGSSTSGITEAEAAIKYRLKHQAMPNDYYYSRQEMGAVSEFIRICAQVSGPCYTVSTACSSSAKVFKSAMNLLRLDICDAVIVGGADSLCRLTLNGFGSLELLSDERSIPFSANRQGINIGESAALFLLTKSHQGVQLTGVGESSDAFHISSPDPEARGAIRALRHALDDAGITADDVDYINLHGTGTLHNDASEAKAVSAVFNNVVCSSTKPMVGHTLGASGATEAGFCWLILNDFIESESGDLKLPPHCYDGEYDPNIPMLPLVKQNESIRKDSHAICVSNSFGFGGSNCAIVLKGVR